jgi:hypothetical protein
MVEGWIESGYGMEQPFFLVMLGIEHEDEWRIGGAQGGCFAYDLQGRAV